jgi:phosphoribosyl-AMP cyclohydrolase
MSPLLQVSDDIFGFNQIRTREEMAEDVEQGSLLTPRWDAAGLITAVLTDYRSGDVLMVAHMNAEALQRTIESGEAWFWSRSRKAMWKKGETSGHVMRVAEIRIDCDQDSVWLKVDPAGPACHTGERSCFYRRIEHNGLKRDD